MGPPLPTEQVLDRFDSLADGGDADAVELCLLGRAAEHTRYAGDRIHQPQDVTETQLLVRAVVDGQAGRASTTTLTGLSTALARATDAARRAARDHGHGSVRLATPGDESPDPPVWFDDTSAFDVRARSALASDTMRRAHARGIDVAGVLSRAVTQQIVVTSTGVRRATVATEAYGSLTAAVGAGSAHWIDLGRSADRLAAADAVVATLDRADRCRGPVALAPGEYAVVLGPEAVGELAQFLPAFGFDGALAAAGIGLCSTATGTTVAPVLVDVADDAFADVGLPIGFDIEGTSKRRVPFLDHGVVGAPVTDLATARELSGTSSGHAHIAREQAPAPEAANIVMAAGPSSDDDLVAGIDDGVYIERFWYTRLVDSVRSTITGVTRDACFRIRGGELAEPVAGTRFTQSVLGVLAAVDGVGAVRRSQPTMNVWNGAVSAPAVRATGFRLGSKHEVPA